MRSAARRWLAHLAPRASLRCLGERRVEPRCGGCRRGSGSSGGRWSGFRVGRLTALEKGKRIESGWGSRACAAGGEGCRAGVAANSRWQGTGRAGCVAGPFLRPLCSARFTQPQSNAQGKGEKKRGFGRVRKGPRGLLFGASRLEIVSTWQPGTQPSILQAKDRLCWLPFASSGMQPVAIG